jgi:hypothetical protein
MCKFSIGLDFVVPETFKTSRPKKKNKMIKSRHHGKLKTNTNVQAQIALILIIESHVNNEVATHSNKTKIGATQSLVQNSINSRIISLFV